MSRAISSRSSVLSAVWSLHTRCQYHTVLPFATPSFPLRPPSTATSFPSPSQYHTVLFFYALPVPRRLCLRAVCTNALVSVE
eukprot:3761587-Rhodomonas_salina.1